MQLRYAQELSLTGYAQDLANAIQDLLASPELIGKWGRRGRQLVVERYNSEVQIRKLISFYGKSLGMIAALA